MAEWITLPRGPLAPNWVLFALSALGKQTLRLERAGARVQVEQGYWRLLWRKKQQPDEGLVRMLLGELGIADQEQPLVPMHEEVIESELRGLRDASLALLTDFDSDDTDAARPAHGHLAAVVRDKPGRRAAEVAAELSTHTRYLRITAARDPEGKTLYLFHVHEDSSDGSSLEAFLRAGGLDGTQLLRPYGRPGHLMFLPEDAVPWRVFVEAVGLLCERVPALFELSPEHPANPGHGLLFALFREREDSRKSARLLLLPLRAKVLLDRTAIWPELPGYGSIDVVDLDADKEVIADLRRQLTALPRRSGYRLGLQRLRKKAPAGPELERLVDEIQRLQDRRDWLLARRVDTALLYRFDQSQLSCLADLLRRYPPGTLASGAIRYAYQSAPGHAFHLVLVETSGVNPRPPVTMAVGLGEGCRDVVFEVDPYWARYQDRARRKPVSRIFVPRGYTLFPTLSAWSGGDADAYLQEAIGNLVPELPPAKLPAHPIYLFVPDGERLGLQVLNAEQFTVLTRDVIGWINDNLVVYAGHDRDVVVQALAGAEFAHELGRTARKRRKEAECSVQEAAQSAYDALSGQIRALLDAMAAEGDRLAAEAEGFQHQLAQLQGQVALVRTIYEQHDGVERNAIQREATKTRQAAERLQDKGYIKVAAVVAAMRETERAVAEIGRTVAGRIEDLDNTVRRLRVRLEGAWRR